jgi:gamma-glutamyltranspeptidase/glutathione hydrolase
MRDLQLPGRSPVITSNGMVSTSQPLSTSAALTVLKDGGNAMDAALAACAVQAVVEPAHQPALAGTVSAFMHQQTAQTLLR